MPANLARRGHALAFGLDRYASLRGKPPKRMIDRRESAARRREKERKKYRQQRQRMRLRRSSFTVDQISDQFSRTVAIPFRWSPNTCAAFALGNDDVGGGQSPSAILRADFCVGIENDRVGDFQFL